MNPNYGLLTLAALLVGGWLAIDLAAGLMRQRCRNEDVRNLVRSRQHLRRDLARLVDQQGER